MRSGSRDCLLLRKSEQTGNRREESLSYIKEEHLLLDASSQHGAVRGPIQIEHLFTVRVVIIHLVTPAASGVVSHHLVLFLRLGRRSKGPQQLLVLQRPNGDLGVLAANRHERVVRAQRHARDIVIVAQSHQAAGLCA